MYTCGITPYDAAHLGHAATYLLYDVLQRRLIDLGHTTRCVRNVTDIDDPLFEKARQLGVFYLDLAAEEMARFDSCMKALDLLPAFSEPRATSRHPRHPRLHRDGPRHRARLRVGRFGVLRRLLVRRVREGVSTSTARRCCSWPPRTAATRTTRTSATRSTSSSGSRRRRTSRRGSRCGVPVVPGWHIECSALALRELGHDDDRPARRRDRPDLSAPRVRDGAVRGGDGPAVRPSLAARAARLLRGDEDVEVARQPRVRERPAQGLGAAGDPPRRAGPPLPLRVGVDRRAHAGGDRAARAVARRDGGGVADGPSRRGCARRSTTTSTRRRRWRRSTRPRRRAVGRRTPPRCSASPSEVDLADLDPDPIVQFCRWKDELSPHDDAVTLATAGADGAPNARIVLVKGARRPASSSSRTGRRPRAGELAANPRAALVFHWDPRSVRVRGSVEEVTETESDAYWAGRPRGSQLGAWASAQSTVIADRRVLEAAAGGGHGDRFEGADVPSPAASGAATGSCRRRSSSGTTSDDRLHDRIRYRREGDAWVRERLSP